MKWVTIALVIILPGVTGAPARGQSVGVYFDPNATTCSIQIPQDGFGYFSIIANLVGPAAGGITGIECRFEVQAVNFWTFWCLPEAFPGCNEIISSDGARIVWPSCQPGTGGLLELGRYFFLTIGTTPTTYLRIVAHREPANPDLACPTMRLCDGPVYTSICVPGGQAIVNGPPCTVATQQSSWAQVKSLFD